MKFFKRMISAICILFILIGVLQPSLSFERKDHDKCLQEVFFKNFKSIEKDSPDEEKVKLIESASYLAIDQFNSYGQSDLSFLHEHGVSGIPSEIHEISFNASGRSHRSYTHRGWNFHYVGLAAELWPVRKQLLISTAESIFDFHGNDAQRDSFCALIYYIHLLGDHLDDQSYIIKNGLKMDVGGRIDKQDIVSELLNHIAIIFKDQQHTHKYGSLTSNLEQYNYRLSQIIRSEGGINTELKFNQKQEYTKKVLNLLTMYIPEMLKDEPFFNEVFYS